MLLAALSCFQGRPQSEAARLLIGAGAGGIQLTPGCAPDEGPWPEVPTRTHHGFTPLALRARVWDGGRLLVRSDSIHPPKAEFADAFWTQAESGAFAGQILEGMYPGYVLGCGEDLDRAMALGLLLAIDVSHLHIQRCAGVIDGPTLPRLYDYGRIAEVHVSANDGRSDAHRPITACTYGLDWARERLAAGTCVILESYMHTLTPQQRAEQLGLLQGAS